MAEAETDGCYMYVLGKKETWPERRAESRKFMSKIRTILQTANLSNPNLSLSSEAWLRVAALPSPLGRLASFAWPCYHSPPHSPSGTPSLIRARVLA